MSKGSRTIYDEQALEKKVFHTLSDLDIVRGTQATTSRRTCRVPNSKVTFSLRFTWLSMHVSEFFTFVASSACNRLMLRNMHHGT